jgi:hypothetical protein
VGAGGAGSTEDAVVVVGAGSTDDAVGAVGAGSTDDAVGAGAGSDGSTETARSGSLSAAVTSLG